MDLTRARDLELARVVYQTKEKDQELAREVGLIKERGLERAVFPH